MIPFPNHIIDQIDPLAWLLLSEAQLRANSFPLGSPACVRSDGQHSGALATASRAALRKDSFLGLDCEMCINSKGDSQLARVSLVRHAGSNSARSTGAEPPSKRARSNVTAGVESSASSDAVAQPSRTCLDCDVVLDIFVKPTHPVRDYLTPYSGVTAALLANATHTFEEAQAAVLEVMASAAEVRTMRVRDLSLFSLLLLLLHTHTLSPLSRTLSHTHTHIKHTPSLTLLSHFITSRSLSLALSYFCFVCFIQLTN